MNDSAETIARRAEIDERHAFVAGKLAESKIDQLLLMEPPNLAWFAGAPLARGIVDPAEQPCMIVSSSARTIVCSNIDSQRLFDAFLDGLGFQLKEWPWHAGRDQLLADLCENKTIAADRALRDASSWVEDVRRARITLSPLSQTAMRALGDDLSHSIEATCRNIEPAQSESEIAGHLGHRLLRRGLEPIAVHVAADSRLVNDLRPAYGSATVGASCVIIATVRRDGLHATAARTVWFGPPFEEFRAGIDAAGPIAATVIAALRNGASIANVFEMGQRVAEAIQHEHDWRLTPMGWFTGRLPVEGMMQPESEEQFATGQAVVMQSRIGPALFADTYLVNESQAECLSGPDDWPVRRFKMLDGTIDLPDILIR